MAVGRPLVASSTILQLVAAIIMGRLEQLSERARERERERERGLFTPLNIVLPC